VVAAVVQDLARFGLSAYPNSHRDVDIRIVTEAGLVGVIECKAAVTGSVGWGKVYGAIGQVMYYGRAVSTDLPLGICFYPTWASGLDDGSPIAMNGVENENIRSRLEALDINMMFAWQGTDGMPRTHGVDVFADRVHAYAASLRSLSAEN